MQSILKHTVITASSLPVPQKLGQLAVPPKALGIEEQLSSSIILDAPVTIRKLELAPTSSYFFKISQDQKKTVRPTTVTESTKLLSDLCSLAKFLQENGIDFYLSGGLSYEMHARAKHNDGDFKFTRKHSDIDLQVDEHNFEKIKKLLVDKKLYFAVLKYKRRIAPERNIEIWKKDIKSDSPNRLHLFIPGLPKIDIFLSKHENGTTITRYNNIFVRNHLSLDSGVSFIAHNTKIKLLNLAHITPFKSDRRAQSIHDLNLVRSIL